MNKLKINPMYWYVSLKNSAHTSKPIFSKAYIMLTVGLVGVYSSCSMIFGAGEDLLFNVKIIMGDLYGALFAISTGLALLISLIALMFKMVASNPRTIEAANMWIKRVLTTWVIINILGFIFQFLGNLTAGGSAEWDKMIEQ